MKKKSVASPKEHGVSGSAPQKTKGYTVKASDCSCMQLL